MASALTRRFGLVGVNGLDVVIGRDSEGAARSYLLEVNPRFSGSMELAEQALGVNVFSMHLEGVAGRLPDAPAAVSDGCVGKAIVYARHDIMVPATEAWLDRGVRDVPLPGQRIGTGHPVCTVSARGRDRRACLAILESRASGVHVDCESDTDAWHRHPTDRDYAHARAG